MTTQDFQGKNLVAVTFHEANFNITTAEQYFPAVLSEVAGIQSFLQQRAKKWTGRRGGEGGEQIEHDSEFKKWQIFKASYKQNAKKWTGTAGGGGGEQTEHVSEFEKNSTHQLQISLTNR